MNVDFGTKSDFFFPNFFGYACGCLLLHLLLVSVIVGLEKIPQ